MPSWGEKVDRSLPKLNFGVPQLRKNWASGYGANGPVLREGGEGSPLALALDGAGRFTNTGLERTGRTADSLALLLAK